MMLVAVLLLVSTQTCTQAWRFRGLHKDRLWHQTHVQTRQSTRDANLLQLDETNLAPTLPGPSMGASTASTAPPSSSGAALSAIIKSPASSLGGLFRHCQSACNPATGNAACVEQCSPVFRQLANTQTPTVLYSNPQAVSISLFPFRRIFTERARGCSFYALLVLL